VVAVDGSITRIGETEALFRTCHGPSLLEEPAHCGRDA